VHPDVLAGGRVGAVRERRVVHPVVELAVRVVVYPPHDLRVGLERRLVDLAGEVERLAR
jgi:hypothetical protein